jgi:arginine deiminase
VLCYPWYKMEQLVLRDLQPDLEAVAGMTIGCASEYDPARVILVKRPGHRDYSDGMNQPATALFEGPGNMYTAIREHNKYTATLRERGAVVLDVVEVLLHGTIDANGEPAEGEAIEKLRDLAYDSLRSNTGDVALPGRKYLEVEKVLGIAMKHPLELVHIILSQPKQWIKPSMEGNTIYKADILHHPMFNLMFTRDQMFTTDKGVVVGAMNSSQRQSETTVMELVLDRLGITPVYTVDRDCGARIEGGDFIPCGLNSAGQSYAMLGQGLRTNEGAIEELVVENGHKIFGYDLLAVVKEPLLDQDEMHLDTYFGVVGPGRGLILDDRLTNIRKVPLVDIYEKQPDGIYLLTEGLTLPDFFKEMGMEVLPLPLPMQRHYGLNGLTIGPNKLLGVDIGDKATIQATYQRILDHDPRAVRYKEQIKEMIPTEDFATLQADYTTRLRDFGVDAEFVEFTHLTRAYGGPHCLTQVLVRGN